VKNVSSKKQKIAKAAKIKRLSFDLKKNM